MEVFQMPRFKKYVKKLPRPFQQVVLMAYKAENNFLVLYQIGSHENFYKNLKNYLKEIGG